MVRTGLKITILTIGHKPPEWVSAAVNEYVKRLSRFCALTIKEIPVTKQEQLSQFIPNNSHCIALDIIGKSYHSEALANHIEQLQLKSSHWCILIGGAEGLPTAALNLCHESWSLSALTLPHMLARIVVLEALYRSFTIITNHPYHK